MHPQIVQPPLLPSWNRFRKLFGGSAELSVLRALEYEILGQMKYSGKILDFGGGRNSNYRDRMQEWTAGCTYETANIDRAIEPTYLIEPGQPLPVESNTFDIVITLNTLEHIFEVQQALQELLRVLKPEGELVATVPFLFRIHGHPDDFLRGTPSWWGRTLERIGFSKIVMTPLLWGPMSTGLSVAGIPGPLKRARMRAALLLDWLYARRLYRYDRKRYTGAVGMAICNAPLGFLISARKPRPVDQG
jgi:SAM-dependent methyltransferase